MAQSSELPKVTESVWKTLQIREEDLFLSFWETLYRCVLAFLR